MIIAKKNGYGHRTCICKLCIQNLLLIIIMKTLEIKYTRMLTKIQRGNFQFFNYELIINSPYNQVFFQ